MRHKILNVVGTIFILTFSVSGIKAQDRFIIDYENEVIRCQDNPGALVDCSAAMAPFKVVPLKSLITNSQRTIYCRLSTKTTSADIVAVNIPGRPQMPALIIDYANTTLTGDKTGMEWQKNPAGHKVMKINVAQATMDTVAKFPGLVGEREQRLSEVQVEINGVYRPMHPSARLSLTDHKPWFGTGLYAPPAEIIIIKKPESLRGKKITCRIGASSSTLAEKHRPWKRLQKTFIVRELKDDTTHVYNINGGNIYIIPDEPFEKPEIFIVSGAVKSPDFILGKTDPQEWMEELRSTAVPVAEIACSRMIWTMSTRILKQTKEPVALMKFYEDVIINDFNAFCGLSDTASDYLHRSPQFASRCVRDTQLHAGAAYAGYPNMFGSGLPYAERAVNLDRIKSGEGWGFYHEVGHTYQDYCWKWMDGPGSINEVSNNLFIMHSHNRLFRAWPSNNVNTFPTHLNKIRSIPFADRDFENDNHVDGTGRMIPFCQLAQKFGWRLFAYIEKCARELPGQYAVVLSGSTASGRREFFCKRVCEYANADMREFFDFWGIKYRHFAAADMATLPEYAGEKFWEVWNAANVPDPDKDVMRVPEKRLPDNNYDMKEGEIIRENWLLVENESEYYVSSGEPQNTPCKMLDGSGSTYWASQNVKRPAYDNKPVVVFDMGQQNTFNYIEYKHRNFDYNRVNCKKFKVEIRSDATNNWTEVGEFENTEDRKEFQHFGLPSSVSGRYLRLTFLEGIQEGGNTTGAVCVAEFKIGMQ